MEECLREGGLAEIQCASRGYRLKGVDSSTGVLTKNGRVIAVWGGGVVWGHMRHVDYKTISLIISPIISSELIVRTIRLIVRTISPPWDPGG